MYLRREDIIPLREAKASEVAAVPLKDILVPLRLALGPLMEALVSLRVDNCSLKG